MSTEARPVADRLWARVDRTDSGCWLWTGGRSTARNGFQYGVMKVGGKPVRAHRVAWEVANGPIPAGAFVCHHCDTPLCVNPAHLFLGTHDDNMEDMARKGRGRSAMGMRHWKAKLTDDDVAEIRRRFTGRRGEQTQLAHAFGISTAHVHRILVGTSRRVA